jgi:hypothetical protein
MKTGVIQVISCSNRTRQLHSKGRDARRCTDGQVRPTSDGVIGEDDVALIDVVLQKLDLVTNGERHRT